MAAVTLQSVLKDKYNIEEPLLAEGIFVALVGNTKYPISLVGLGIANSFLAVAQVVIVVNELDYELISLTPLALLKLSCYMRSHRLKVSSEYKATQVFQINKSRRASRTWNTFVRAIREITDRNRDKRLDDWYDEKFVLPEARDWLSKPNTRLAPAPLHDIESSGDGLSEEEHMKHVQKSISTVMEIVDSLKYGSSIKAQISDEGSVTLVTRNPRDQTSGDRNIGARLSAAFKFCPLQWCGG